LVTYFINTLGDRDGRKLPFLNNSLIFRYRNNALMKKKEQIHSSFWLGKRTEDLFGSDYEGGSSTVAKAVKMRSYHRAVSNFVKILTKQEIPVVFKGSNSYTNGKSINISADISNKNFDVNVGLALHEASHIILTDFNAGKEIVQKYGKDAFNLLNWVEDRRIDNYVIKNAPGYANYYTALYDYYFRKDEAIGKFFKSRQSRDASKVITYMQHIINMLHPNFNPNALPRLKEIVDIIDLPNIARLKSTSDSIDVALKVYEIITSAVKQEQANPEQEENPANKREKTASNKANTENGTDSPDEEENDDTTQENEEEDETEETPEESGTPEYQRESGQGSGEGEEAGEEEEELEELSDAEMGRILREYREQVDFTNGEVEKHKKSADRKVLQRIEDIADEDINLYNSSYGKCSLLVHDFTRVTPNLKNNSHFVDPTQIPDGHSYAMTQFYMVDAITTGMQLGAGLGRRLKLVGETRSLVTNRLKSGSIDKRRLAGLGYGVENVFNQITVEQYKKANIHISLDTSGSMQGASWKNAVQATIAIAKAAMATSGQVQVQVSTRDTAGLNTAVASIIYDSRYNGINQLIKYLAASRINSSTPEGLCFEGLLKANKLIPGTAEMDSYFINISDGQPYFNSYNGYAAIKHTQKQVKAIKQLGISILGYYVSAARVPATDHCYTIFKQMYGEQDSKVCNPDSLVEMAKTLNDKFLEAKVSTTR
jgi:cobalamin biosynthesis protein CobT